MIAENKTLADALRRLDAGQGENISTTNADQHIVYYDPARYAQTLYAPAKRKDRVPFWRGLKSRRKGVDIHGRRG